MNTIEKVIDQVRTLGPQAAHILPDLEALQREVIALNIVNALSVQVAGITEQEDVDQVLQGILSAALSLSQADRGMVVLTNPEHPDGFDIRAARKLTDEDSDDLKLSRTLIRDILARGDGVYTDNVQNDQRFDNQPSLLAANIRSVMATPIKHQEEVIGGIYVDCFYNEKFFEQEDLRTLSAFANHVAVALNLATSIKARYELYVQSILALVNAVEAADPYTAGHSSRVGYYARGIALELGLDERDVELITFAGYLHDVGKIAMSSIIAKTEPLSDEEFAEIRRHTLYGERILRNSPALKDILPGVRSHHEKWSGGGYPDDLKGNTIHLYARIVIAVADVFDTITTERPYKKALETEHALNVIRKDRVVAFEPSVANAFITAFTEGRLTYADRTKADGELYTSMATL